MSIENEGYDDWQAETDVFVEKTCPMSEPVFSETWDAAANNRRVESAHILKMGSLLLFIAYKNLVAWNTNQN